MANAWMLFSDIKKEVAQTMQPTDNKVPQPFQLAPPPLLSPIFVDQVRIKSFKVVFTRQLFHLNAVCPQ